MKLVKEILVPAERGVAYHVKKGQTQRVIMVDGPQVGDWIAFNVNNFKEHFCPTHSYIHNNVAGTGTNTAIRDFYSRPPHLNIMFTVTADTVGTHWVMSGGKCTPQRYKFWGVEGHHRSCFENLAEAIDPFGLTPEDVPDVFNMFMNVEYDQQGHYHIKAPAAGKGGYIDMRAEMDCLVALSACPAGDVSLVNGEGPDKGNKPLKVEIYE
ncbi:MAG: urea carboxylase-associated family protein [Chloroflexi bacterium]|nr:urea carboxylase-associated family protein [Chloroflexota bacterium]